MFEGIFGGKKFDSEEYDEAKQEADRAEHAATRMGSLVGVSDKQPVYDKAYAEMDETATKVEKMQKMASVENAENRREYEIRRMELIKEVEALLDFKRLNISEPIDEKEEARGAALIAAIRETFE